MEVGKMELKKMTFDQYDKYLDVLEEQKEKVDNGEISTRKMGFNLAKWVLLNVYGIDTEKVEYSQALWVLFDKTVALTEERENKDEKNSVTSGTGELKAE